MYIAHMRRVQIYLEEDVDEAISVEAARRSISKAALIRLFVAEHLAPARGPRMDPFAALVGAYEGEPGSIDELVYDRSS